MCNAIEEENNICSVSTNYVTDMFQNKIYKIKISQYGIILLLFNKPSQWLEFLCSHVPAIDLNQDRYIVLEREGTGFKYTVILNLYAHFIHRL